MSSESPETKLGAGHASAMARQGLAELRAAFYADSNVAQPTEYGMYGKPTPQEIVSDKQADQSLDAQPSVLEGRLESAEPAGERDSEAREAPEPERE